MIKFIKKNWFKLGLLLVALVFASSFFYRFAVTQQKRLSIPEKNSLTKTLEEVKEGYKLVKANNPEISFSFQIPADWDAETRNSGEKTLSPDEIRDFYLTGKRDIIDGRVYVIGKDVFEDDVNNWSDSQLVEFFNEHKEGGLANTSVAKNDISYCCWNPLQINFYAKNNIKDKQFIDDKAIDCTQDKCRWENTTIANYLVKIASFSSDDPDIGGTTPEYTGGKTYFINTGKSTLIIEKEGIDEEANESFENIFGELIKSLSIKANNSSNTPKETTDNNAVNKYAIEAIQIGGVGSKIKQVASYEINEVEHVTAPLVPVEDWSSISFNSAGDIMDIGCKDGYYITSCKSDSGNKVVNDEDFGCRLMSEDKMQNRAQIECSKNN